RLRGTVRNLERLGDGRPPAAARAVLQRSRAVSHGQVDRLHGRAGTAHRVGSGRRLTPDRCEHQTRFAGASEPRERPDLGWSPNGLNTAFSSELAGGQLALDVVNLATGTVRQRLGPPGGSASYVAWSPDSRQLLVTTDCTLWRVPAEET